MYQWEKKDDTITMKIQGSLIGEHAELFQSNLKELFEQEFRRLIIDCEEMDFIDSSGIGNLENMQKRLSKDKKDMVMINVSEPIRRLLSIVRFDKLITIE